MYFDTSLKKFASIGITAGVLLIAVAITFQVKNHFFGATPFFPAAGIFFSSAFDSIGYTVSGAGRQTANVFSALFGGEEAPARDARAIPVLTYHRITQWHGSASSEDSSRSGEGSNVSLGAFRDQMEAFHDAGWKTITLTEFEAFIRGEGTLPEKSFLLTFDDGAKDSYYPVDPILSALGYTAVNYLIVTGVERQESTYYLSQPEVERMIDTGRWEIGSHTFDAHHDIEVNGHGDVHVPIANLAWKPLEHRLETTSEYRTRLEGEFAGSRAWLSRTFGVEVNTLAFPFGETGENSKNLPNAEEVVLEEAAKHYDFAFVQNDRDHYTFNYPNKGFLMHRIHVEPEWSGSKLLSHMEGGMPKDLPYMDAMDEDRGWLVAWGEGGIENNALRLRAVAPSTSASALLDGTLLWEDYEVSANVTWDEGYALALFSAPNARTYRSCAFEDGRVRAQQTSDGTTSVLDEVADAAISSGSHSIGARVTSSSVTCLYNGRAVLTVTGLSARTGGIGFQTWSPAAGEARMSVTDVTVEPL